MSFRVHLSKIYCLTNFTNLSFVHQYYFSVEKENGFLNIGPKRLFFLSYEHVRMNQGNSSKLAVVCIWLFENLFEKVKFVEYFCKSWQNNLSGNSHDLLDNNKTFDCKVMRINELQLEARFRFY